MRKAKLTYGADSRPASITAYLPPALDRAVRQMAEQENMSLNQVMTLLIQRGLEPGRDQQMAAMQATILNLEQWREDFDRYQRDIEQRLDAFEQRQRERNEQRLTIKRRSPERPQVETAERIPA